MLLGRKAAGAEGLAESEKLAVAERGEHLQTGCAPSPCLQGKRTVREPEPPAVRWRCTNCSLPTGMHREQARLRSFPDGYTLVS